MNNLNHTENPWLGLKSYSEGKRLYGRDKEIDDLSQKILYNTQTVIYGKSGIGKSSLLKAGVFPILRRNGYFPVYVRFVHEESECSYTAQIKTAIDESLKRLKVEDLGAPDSDIYKIVEGYRLEVVPINDLEREESLWEYFHRHQFYYKLNEDSEAISITPILVFDQFEEIFTLQKDESKIKHFFDEFAGLLNNVCPKYLLQPTIEVDNVSLVSNKSSLIKRGLVKTEKRRNYIEETNLHVVLSLREDFLSHLERNIEHIPSLKHNRYCLLPLNEDQAAEIIMQPLPGLISVEVAKEIICKVTGASPNDFEIDDNPELEVDSAILSLFLSELYVRKGSAVTISKELVDLFGSNIISDFYEKTVSDSSNISESSVRFLEKRLVTKDERRDSIFKEQALRNGVTEDELRYLHSCRLLHLYPWRDGIRIEFSHDVLCPIVIGRRKMREDKLEKQRQYDAYLKMKKEKQRLLYALCLTILSLIIAALFVYDGWYHVKVDRFAYVVKEKTWMKGIKSLSEHKASYLNHHYVFYRTGRYADYPDSVEARNGYGDLTTEHNLSTYLVNQYDDTDNKADQQIVNKLKTVVKWVLSSDKSGRYCIKENAYDKEGKLIFSYNNSLSDNDSIFISTYVDELGFPIIMRDSCYIYLRTKMDNNGREVLQEFFDNKGFPVMNKDGAFQTAREYFSNGVQKCEASQFLNGHKMIDRVGNCGWEILELADNAIDPLLSIYFDADRKPCRINDGTMFKRWEYDDYGRVIKETYWKIPSDYENIDIDLLKFALDEKIIELLPDTNIYGVHGYINEFNRYGKNTALYTIDMQQELVQASNREYAQIQRNYDSKGNLVKEILVDLEGRNVWEYFAEYSNDGELVFNKSYSIDIYSDTIMNYHLYYDNEKKRKIEKIFDSDFYTYYEYDVDKNIRMMAWYKTHSDEPDSISNGKHKTMYDYKYNKDLKQLIITETYYNKDGYICAYEDGKSYFKEITVIDSISHTKSTIRYTTKDVLEKGIDSSPCYTELFYQGVEQLYNADFTISLGEASIDVHGVKRRTYENAAYYYQVKYINSILPSHENESNGHYAVNEFGEPSLVRIKGNLYSALYNDTKYDEYGHAIGDEELDRTLFAAIETNTNIGFEYGDILVQQDDWVLWRKGSFDNLDLEPQPTRDHHFKVLRFNESTKEYDVVEINIPRGDERITSIEYKKFYVTKAEENRIYDIMKREIYGWMFEFVPKENGALYEQGMRTPALVLSVNEWDMTRNFHGNRDSFILELKRQIKDTNHVVVYNEELKEVQSYEVDSDTLGVSIESYSLTPRYYNQLKEIMLKNKE